MIDADQQGDGVTRADAPQVQQTVTVLPASQAITFTSAAPDPGFEGGAYVPTATGGATGNPVVFSIDPTSTPGACSIDPTGAVVFFIGPGVCVIDANQMGDGVTWADAPQVQQTVTVL